MYKRPMSKHSKISHREGGDMLSWGLSEEGADIVLSRLLPGSPKMLWPQRRKASNSVLGVSQLIHMFCAKIFRDYSPAIRIFENNSAYKSGVDGCI